MNDIITPGSALRDAARAETMQAPGATCALAGRLIERMGFPAVYLSGKAVSAAVLGLPDLGLVTLTELVQQTTYLTRNLNVPTIVDAGTGFGDTMSVERTVIELEAAGAAAIQFVDQQTSSHFGDHSRETLVATELMCAKLRAATAAKFDPDTVIVARTDARVADGIDAALERAHQYIDAGADWIFPAGLADEAEFARCAEELSAPLLADTNEFGQSPLYPISMFREWGYAAVIYPVSMLRVTMRAIEAALGVIMEDGTQQELLDLMQTSEELDDLLDYEEFELRGRNYFGR